MSERCERIAGILERAFAPASLDVRDESHLHEGHSGWRQGETTHVRVRIVAAAFAGRGRLERHRLVNAALADELAGGLHALAIAAHAPDEPARER